MSEFEIIRRYFTRASSSAVLGIGDDAALVRVAPECELAVSTDTLIEGRHFFAGADPYPLGRKSLAVNLSDMAAIGAQPRWILLSLSLPGADEKWLELFSRGLFELADKHAVELIGGDTCRGPLSICVTIMGEVAAGRALRRDGARPGDDVWVSGSLGDAALALAHLENRIALSPDDFERCARALDYPVPRIELGRKLHGIASALIDISDGLTADLGHILERSHVGATIKVAGIPRSAILRRYLPARAALQALLAGGDDYELCFTAPSSLRAEVKALARKVDVPLTCIGKIESAGGLRLLDERGHAVDMELRAFDHFA
jgi:thiamine-monophosphate kinase